ncbi:MAG: SMP-30/gluconolactonase/LRE family protein [Bradyrhizobiaceae bacterium]|nr:SMP-30/gluconolactonase/LRE family protein [Hyphomicrobiales bacterium]MBV9426913.1 SMP-30/gluconolactonase/LRE family protein [Bradyrhizobiaceae bacterium]
MTGWKFAAAALALSVGAFAAVPAQAWKRGNVDVLATLPFASGSVEGITVGPDGNIYAPTFGFNASGPLSGNALLFKITPNGKVSKVTIANSSPHMLGLRFNPATGALWVLDFGAGKVLSVDPNTGGSTLLAGPIANSGLNALTFDSSGNGYVSDSFNGTIWKIGPHGGGATSWKTDPLLGNGGGALTPPFGANGVEFSNDHSKLFVANTAFHQIIQIAVNGDTTAGAASIYVSGINAPDGIAIDKQGNMWICANQEDEIVVLDPTGKVIAKLGDFGGIDEHGIAKGLLFPASLAFSNDGSTLYVSNLTLYLPFADPNPGNIAIDSPWMLQVKGYTVSSLSTKIPQFPDGP